MQRRDNYLINNFSNEEIIEKSKSHHKKDLIEVKDFLDGAEEAINRIAYELQDDRFIGNKHNIVKDIATMLGVKKKLVIAVKNKLIPEKE